MAAAAADAFAQWEDPIAGALRAAGVRRAEAARPATLVVAAIEGAIVLCRAPSELRPLTAVGRELEDAVRGAIEAGAARGAASRARC